MSYIEIGTICFGLAAAISLLTAVVEILISDKGNPVDWDLVTKGLIVGLVLTGVTLWSWRFAEAFSAFAEALK